MVAISKMFVQIRNNMSSIEMRRTQISSKATANII